MFLLHKLVFCTNKALTLLKQRLKVEKEEDDRENEEVVRMEMDKTADSTAPLDDSLVNDS